jgi:hypothetical protein
MGKKLKNTYSLFRQKFENHVHTKALTLQVNESVKIPTLQATN